VQRLQGLLSCLPHLHTMHLLATPEPPATSSQRLLELAGLAAANPQLLCLTYNQQVLVDVRQWSDRVVPSAHLSEAKSTVTTVAAAGGRSSTAASSGSTTTADHAGTEPAAYRRRSSGSGSMAEAQAAARGTVAAPAGASSVGEGRKGGSKQHQPKAAPLTAALLEHDERIKYSLHQLEQLRVSPLVTTQGLPAGSKEHGCYKAW
jgi:hypothetical protein